MTEEHRLRDALHQASYALAKARDAAKDILTLPVTDAEFRRRAARLALKLRDDTADAVKAASTALAGTQPAPATNPGELATYGFDSDTEAVAQPRMVHEKPDTNTEGAAP